MILCHSRRQNFKHSLILKLYPAFYFDFNNLEGYKFNERLGESEGPAKGYRLVEPRLNLEGKCFNQNYTAYIKRIWISKGFEKFSTGE